jgi:hypothetical protein
VTLKFANKKDKNREGSKIDKENNSNKDDKGRESSKINRGNNNKSKND